MQQPATLVQQNFTKGVKTMQQLDNTYYLGKCDACQYEQDQLVRQTPLGGGGNVFLCRRDFEREMEHRRWRESMGAPMDGYIYGFYEPTPEQSDEDHP